MAKYCYYFLLVAFVWSGGCVRRIEGRFATPPTTDFTPIHEEIKRILDYVEGRSTILPEMFSLGRKLKPGEPESNGAPGAKENNLSGTSKVLESLGKMRDRNREVVQLKEAGCLGESNRGLLVLRECEQIATAKERNTVQRLIAAENKDRAGIYNEIARLNRDIPGTNVALVQSLFVLERLRRATASTWIQLPDEGSAYTAALNIGWIRGLSGKVRPNEWVFVP